MDNKPVAEMHAKLVELTDIYDRAKKEEREASSTAMNALNDLNKAQKQFDELVAEMKKNAPADTDWRRSTHSAARI